MRSIGQRLLAAQIAAGSYGLAAAHIGETEPVIVINCGSSLVRQDQVWFNPKVSAVADETVLGTEGSVSLPGVEAQILRPIWAQFNYENETGQPVTVRHDGFLARVALHEIDQVNGIFFLDHLSRLKRDRLVKKSGKHHA